MKKHNTDWQRPEAWIAVSNNRQKIYGENEVYLDKDQEFQIELYNPTQSKFLTKIYINGKPMSFSGLILNPGQRYFLDRFIDEDKKLLFSTYEVDGNSEEVKKAIENNGLVRVEFYLEAGPYFYGNSISWTTTTNGGWKVYDDWIYSTASPIAGSFTTTNTSGIAFSGTVNNASSQTSYVLNTSNPMETGRVEKGSKSDQNFGADYGSYNTYSSYVSEYKLLPRSVKPVEVSELRSYCTECGTRVKKKTWKFCPNCGEALD